MLKSSSPGLWRRVVLCCVVLGYQRFGAHNAEELDLKPHRRENLKYLTPQCSSLIT
jgi:hypothetical protein